MLILVAMVFIALVILFITMLYLNRKEPPAQELPPSAGFKQCPLCLKTLKPGERVKTIAYPGDTERLVHLYGCPDCQKEKNKAKCPVCKKKLKARDYLIGKLWEEDEKNRVHVIGCNRC